MTARGYLRGYPIEYRDGQWYYEDIGLATLEVWKKRPCGHCGRENTPEGHDGCLGTLPGVRNACCGHGQEDEAYLQMNDGRIIQGREALEMMEGMRADSEGGEG